MEAETEGAKATIAAKERGKEGKNGNFATIRIEKAKFIQCRIGASLTYTKNLSLRDC